MTVTELEIQNHSLENKLRRIKARNRKLKTMTRTAILKSTMKRAQWETIVAISAKMFGTTPNDVKGPRRHLNKVMARHTSATLIRSLTGASTEEIGAFLGGRDHGTIILACKSIQDRLETDPDFRFRFNAVKSIVLEAIQ